MYCYGLHEPLKIFRSVTFSERIFLLILGIVCFQLAIICWYIPTKINKILYDEVGSRALIQAKQLAHNPIIIRCIQMQNTERLRNYVYTMQHRYSDADYIVIGDANQIHLVHPDPAQIGQHMEGNDNRFVLQNHAEVTMGRGTLGLSMRGKAPIEDQQGHIIGIVSVGYFINSIASWTYTYLTPFIVILLLMFSIAVIASYSFAKHIKNKMLHMEPEEIALSLRTKSAILKSIYEGIIAINIKGSIYTINDNALHILGIAEPNIQGKNIRDYVTPWSFFLPDTDSSSTVRDEIMTMNQQYVIANRLPCKLDHKIIGWIISFRKKDELYSLSNQLVEVKKNIENMRVIRHEYANKLSTIGGLIQLGSYQEALQLINQESEEQEHLVTYLTSTFDANSVAAILLSKHSRAKELGMSLEFDPACSLHKALPELLQADELTTIVGNLIDNAFEATRLNPASDRTIHLLLNNDGHELIIEISDNGTGIASDLAEHIFEHGVTTKQESGHGYGMYLVHQYVTSADGYITISDADPCGTIISIFIPEKIQHVEEL